jgi:hypothetical protein
MSETNLHERRCCARHPYGAASPALLAEAGGPETVPVWVRDLSARGAGLALGRPLGANALPALRLPRPDLRGSWQVPARVAWSAPQPKGVWRAGCEFLDDFSAEQVADLLPGRPGHRGPDDSCPGRSAGVS